MFRVFLGKYGFIGNAPIYTKGIIQNTNTTINLWMIKLITLVLEHCRFTQYSKAMSHPFGYKKLAVILCSQFNCHMLTIRWTSFSDVNCHIQYRTFNTTYQFALGIRRSLKVKSSHYAIA